MNHIFQTSVLSIVDKRMYNCRFSYAGTWELVSLFIGEKIFSYLIFHENIGRKHNKILCQETDHGQTELSNMLLKKNVLNEIMKEHSRKVSRTAGTSKGKYLKI